MPDGEGPAVYSLRSMTTADVEAGLRLCRQSHWNQIARDWEQFLRRTPGGACVAVDRATGVVIGSVATMRYAVIPPEMPPGAPAEAARPHVLDWIAMVLVDPAHRGHGIGTALLQRGLAHAGDTGAVGLDATPLGLPLYEKLGFEVEASLMRLHAAAGALGDPGVAAQARHRRRDAGAEHGPDTAVPPRGSRIREATRADLADMARLDAQATGLDRSAMLAWLWQGAPDLAWVSEADGVLDGLLLGRPGHACAHLGPLIAASADVALDLVRSCVGRHAKQPFVMDVVDGRPAWRDDVAALGFESQRPFARMYRGAWRPLARTDLVFAVIGPEFG